MTENESRIKQLAPSTRWIIRILCLSAAVAALLVAPRGIDWTWMVPSLSPQVAIAALIAGGVFQAASGLGLLIGLIAVVRRRWFCRWICPTGLCTDTASRLGRRCGRRPPRLPALGQWVVLATLGGAVLGYPLLLWLDPLAIFAATLTWLDGQSVRSAGWAAATLPVLLGLSLLFPHVWCQRLCPLGGLQDLLSRLSVGRRCEQQSDQPASQETSGVVARRVVLFSLIGVACATMLRRTRAALSRPLRPPGAREERDFPGLCIRCGNCIRACPTHIIQADSTEHGISGWLAPVVRFADDYCREDCTRCTEACPSGALTPVAVEDKQRAWIGLARVDMDVCWLGDDRDCAACRTHCPFDAISFRFDEDTYVLTPEIDPERCPGCGACEVACPTQPVKAIVVEPSAIYA